MKATEARLIEFLKKSPQFVIPIYQRTYSWGERECRQLLSLYHDDHRASADVKAIATAKVAEIDRKIAELKSLRATLHTLVEHCHGDGRPDCPILEDLAGETGSVQ